MRLVNHLARFFFAFKLSMTLHCENYFLTRIDRNSLDDSRRSFRNTGLLPVYLVNMSWNQLTFGEVECEENAEDKTCSEKCQDTMKVTSNCNLITCGLGGTFG